MNLEWQQSSDRLKIKPSVAEERIINCLNKTRVIYYREVQFLKCISNKGFLLCFDFYIPERNLLIEYDGPHHEEQAMKINDELKNKFARENKIILVRLNKADWAILERVIRKLVSQKKMKKKFSKPEKVEREGITKIVIDRPNHSRPDIGRKYRDKYLAQKNHNKKV